MIALHPLVGAIVPVLCLALTSCAMPAPEGRYAGVLPPALKEPWDADTIGTLGGKPLWTEEAGEAAEAHYRLTITGINCMQYSFQIDESRDGWAFGRSAARNQCVPHGKIETAEFRISKSELDSLKSKFEKARLWTTYPQYWRSEEGTICVDGNALIFEKRDAAGYGYSRANWPCNFTDELIEAAELYIEIFDADDAKRLVT